jgi:hypothetical protein
MSEQDAATMKFFGLTAEDYEAENTVGIWPENVEAVNLFAAIGTQWRVGQNGPYGLDYNILYRKLDRMGLSPVRYAELEEEIRILEGAALDEMHKD